MRPARLFAGCAIVAALVVLSSDGLRGQEKKDSTLKFNGALPQGWSKLGLTDKQKDEVYTLQDAHRRKVDEFKEVIAVEDVRLVKARLGLLTDEQRKILREMRGEEPDPNAKKDAPSTTSRSFSRADYRVDQQSAFPSGLTQRGLHAQLVRSATLDRPVSGSLHASAGPGEGGKWCVVSGSFEHAR
jgi:hypothetical protein